MGLKIPCTDSATGDGQGGCDRGADQLGHILALFASQNPDLAEVVKAWPNLPEPIRKGILAMVKASAQ